MVNEYNLTKGALMTIMTGGEVAEPILQVLGSKKITSQSADKERHRLLISDGQYSISFGMITTQMNSSFNPSTLQNYTIIKLKRYITSVINHVDKTDKRVLLLLDFEPLVTGDIVGKIIGDLIPITDEMMLLPRKESNGSNGSTTNVSVTVSVSSHNGASKPVTTAPLNFDRQIISPITSISPYHNQWVIKARVMNKSNIRTWSNSRGEGKLFSFDLGDESGEIRVTAFRDMVDKFYEYLQVDHVYYISKCQVKAANRQFSALKNDYEMTVGNETVIEECTEDDGIIPKIKYDFVALDKVASMIVGTIVDVVGVAKSVSDLQCFQSKNTGRELKKKDIVLVDQSKTAITLALWGAQAEQFEDTNNPVVVIKGAKVGEFGGGKNLSTIMSSQLKVNPDFPECHKLKGWFDSEGVNAEVTNVSARTGSGNFQSPWMAFQDVQDQGLGQSERGDYYQVLGTILLIRSENAVYKACPKEDCNKKVVDLENNTYRCEKCNQEYNSYKYRLLVNMNVGDWSGNQWVSMFSDEAERVLGKTSQEVGEALAEDAAGGVKIFENVNFKQFVFKCRSKVETFNDENRLKTVALKVEPLKHEEYCDHLIEKIQSYLS